jgi:hypothetical protein
MKNLLLVILTGLFLISCQNEEGEIYTSNQVEYPLTQTSEYDYRGIARVREFLNGDLELTLILEGSKGEGEDYFFPAHLHFGPYDSPEAPMATMLSPISIKSLKSTTVLGQLSDGRKLVFEELLNFDGHVKVHLADSGPDYATILVAGNIGKNGN